MNPFTASDSEGGAFPPQFFQLLGLLSDQDHAPIDFPAPKFRSRSANVWKRGLTSLLVELTGRPAISLFGPKLYRGRGRLTISSQLGIQNTVSQIRSKSTVVTLPTDVPLSVVHRLQEKIGFDPTDQIDCIISENDAIVFFGSFDGNAAVAHVGIGQTGKSAISRHLAGLQNANLLRYHDAKIKIPSLLYSRDDQALSIAIQERLKGRPALEGRKSNKDLARAVTKALGLHGECFSAMTSETPVEDRTFISQELPLLLDKLDQNTSDRIKSCLPPLSVWLGDESRIGQLTHGDFWLANIVSLGETTRPPGLIDWEWSRRSSVSFLDAIQLVVMTNAKSRKVSAGQVFGEIWTEGIVDLVGYAPLMEHARKSQFELDDIRVCSMLLWLRYLWQGHVVTYSGGSPWLTSMIEEPLRHLEHWQVK